MHILKSLISSIKNNPLTSILLLILFLTLLGWSVYNNDLVNTIAYLLALLVSVVIVEILAKKDFLKNNWIIKSKKQEVKIIFMVFIFQLITTTIKFIVFPDFQHAEPWIKIFTLALMSLFILPLFFCIYFFLIKKYKPFELGLDKFSVIWTALPVIALLGIISFLVIPEKILFIKVYNDYGLIQMLSLGFLIAAVPEEFGRILAQTRISAFINSKALGWFLASLLWALTHIPNFYSQQHDMFEASMYALKILPIGLLWGFMTHRFKSIWPAVLVHGTNLWGFT
jgi:membrane protease YdiL (CAAX protease family)